MTLKTSKRVKKMKPLNKYGKAAVSACDWFVNSQTNQCRPKWDANHGRVPYNIHMPTKSVVQGLNWSMARATYCLVTAFERTGKQDYLDAAKKAIEYAKTLQVMDSKDPNFGAFHEETQQSPFCYPRDGIETAGGFLALYAITGEKELLRRAELYLDWYFKKAYVKAGVWGYWTVPEIRFDNQKPNLTSFGAYQSGAGYILNYAYQLTGKAKYKKYCVEYAENTLKMYYSGQISPWVDKFKKVSLQDGAKHMGLNDDGQGISILAAYQLTKNPKYLKACQDVCDYYAQNEFSRKSHAGLCCVVNFMIETDFAGGTQRYAKAVQKLIKEVLAKQVKNKDKLIDGGFSGEDEVPDWYKVGAKSEEFVVTRTTAYATLALFKLEGVSWGKGYSTVL